MPALVRKGDICSGHQCYPPRPSVQGSPNVFTNGIPQHRVSDSWAVHCCSGSPPPCHASTQCSGSSTVFANTLPVARRGDRVCCGSRCVQHSPNVFADGN